MSAKRNRKPRKNRNRRSAPRNVSSANLPAPEPPPRPVGPRPGPRPRISAQYVGAGQRPQRRGRAPQAAELAAERSAEPVAETVATTATPSWAIEVPRRLSVSTVILLTIVGLELVAMAVLALHLRASPHDEGSVVSYRSGYAAPVPVPVGTAYVRSTVVAPEALRVTHWVHTGSDVGRVRIRVPHMPGLAPGTVALSDLVIASDGQPVPASRLPGTGPGRTYVVPAGRHIYVRYVLLGALERSSSPAGRALARFTALDVDTPEDSVARTRHTVVGARVLALACSADRPDALPHPCGSETNGTWRVVLGSGHTHDRVTAQMDLS